MNVAYIYIYFGKVICLVNYPCNYQTCKLCYYYMNKCIYIRWCTRNICSITKLGKLCYNMYKCRNICSLHNWIHVLWPFLYYGGNLWRKNVNLLNTRLSEKFGNLLQMYWMFSEQFIIWSCDKFPTHENVFFSCFTGVKNNHHSWNSNKNTARLMS